MLQQSVKDAKSIRVGYDLSYGSKNARAQTAAVIYEAAEKQQSFD